MKGGEDMDWATIIAIVVIVAILFFAIRHLYKERKKGNVCIGCPYSDSCPKKHPGSEACKNRDATHSCCS